MLALFLLACDEARGPGEDTDTATIDEAATTWHRDVAPIVARSCVGCHVDGGIAPFALDSFSAAAPMASAMAAAVEEGRMPPWGAQQTDECTPRLGWKDDLRLSDAEKATLRSWADSGAHEGDATTAAALPEPVSLALDGANQQLSPVHSYVTSGDNDEFICFVLDPALEQTRWLTGVQVLPDNEKVVHHALIFAIDRDDAAALAGDDGLYDCFGGIGSDELALVGAWAPGAAAITVPEGSGLLVEPDQMFVMQIHYHPAGEVADPDASAIDLRWIDEEPEMEAVLALVGNAASESGGLLPGPNDDNGVEFHIPAGAVGHTEEMAFTIQSQSADYRVFLAGTHMHYVGTDMAIWLEEEGNEPECLVQTPAWDFNWQRGYAYDAAVDELPRLNEGDTLRMRCTYDNSLDNPGVREALADQGLSEPVDVRLGEETLDEMCLGIFGVLY
ncbi:MAG: hypothetical protein FJ090_04070 [Deltaproteobacteria bacterium]|nr:hypothetical protein [Deltaproteobacteria bacterium]